MGAVIYARQSLDKDGKGEAVDRQIAACQKLAEARELAVHEIVTDNDTSASKGPRPGFDRVIAGIESGVITTVIVWHTDRLYRRVSDLVRIMDLAEKHDLRIMTVRAGDIDLGNPAGRMYAHMTASVARYEVEQKGARQKDANAQRARAGRWHFSTRPFGYERVDGEVRIVEHEAEALRDAYRRYLAGESYYAITAHLNASGVRTSRGAEWSPSTLRERLANPAYAGILYYKGEHQGDGAWPAIIDRATWNEYQRTRSHRKVRHDWSAKTKYLLSGLAKCGVCGDAMLARPDYGYRRNKGEDGRTSARIAYACRSKWCVQRDMEKVDQAVTAVMIARLSRADAADLLLAPAEEAEPLEAEAREIRARWDELAELLADGILRPTAVREQQAKIQARLDALERRIDSIRSDSEVARIVRSDDVAIAWDGLSLPHRRAIISSLMTVTVHRQTNNRVFDPDAIAIEWR